MRGARRRNGFTLMELLVALAVLALVVTGFLGAFRELLTVTEGYAKESMARQAARQIMGLVINDLECVVFSHDARDLLQQKAFRFKGSGCESDFTGQRTVLAFTTTSTLLWDASFPAHGILEVCYVLSRDETATEGGAGRVRLFRLERPHAGIDADWQWQKVELFDDVRGFEVAFRQSPDGELLDTWDSMALAEGGSVSRRLPRLATVRLTVPMAGGMERTFEAVANLPCTGGSGVDAGT